MKIKKVENHVCNIRTNLKEVVPKFCHCPANRSIVMVPGTKPIFCCDKHYEFMIHTRSELLKKTRSGEKLFDAPERMAGIVKSFSERQWPGRHTWVDDRDNRRE